MSLVQPIVELIDVHKKFGNVQALSNISCKIPRGKVTALVGDNGAGKSTFIKIICGVHLPDSGKFRFQGEEVRWQSPDESRVAGVETVYQDLALVNSLSISRNFFLGKALHKWGRFGPLDRQRMNRDALEGVASLGITLEDADRSVAKLSGGQRKSIAIARSLYFQPKLLVLDEPTAALSIKESQIVLEHVEEVRDRGISVIFISHNIHLIYPLADRFLLLDQGKVLGDVEKHDVSPQDLIDAIVHGTSLGN